MFHLYSKVVMKNLNKNFEIGCVGNPLYIRPYTESYNAGIDMFPAMCQRVWLTFRFECEVEENEIVGMLERKKFGTVITDKFPAHML
jgi:hypothetical protein